VQNDQPIFGFDAAADGDVTVTMLRRTDAGWQVEHVYDPRDASRMVATVAGTPRPWPVPEPPATEPWPDLVDRWMNAHQDITFQLTDEQRDIVRATFERLIAEGKLAL
jgi:hypothetical protein